MNFIFEKEEIIDIEDLAKLGRETKICSYYGARQSITSAEIIALPYNLLFQKETRKSFSINLKNQIVIIDEAHNLIDTIAQIHSVEITEQHVSQSLAQLNNYVTRYKNRFAPKNMLYLKHLTNILTNLNKMFTTKPDDTKLETTNGKLSLKANKIWTISEFLILTKFINLNFIKILRFCEETQLEKKLNGFNEKYYSNKQDENSEQTKTKNSDQVVLKSPILQILQLLKVFTTPYFDGRIMLTVEPQRSSLKFLLLNPSVCFSEILASARSVILAGGTMKPLSDFENLIGDTSRIEYFSCGHVIPKENLVALAIQTGPSGIKFDFSYNSRDNLSMVCSRYEINFSIIQK